MRQKLLTTGTHSQSHKELTDFIVLHTIAHGLMPMPSLKGYGPIVLPTEIAVPATPPPAPIAPATGARSPAVPGPKRKREAMQEDETEAVERPHQRQRTDDGPRPPRRRIIILRRNVSRQPTVPS